MEEGGTERTAGRIIRKLTWQYFSVVVFSNRLSAHSKGLAKTRCYRRVHTRLVLIFPSQRQERVRKALPRKKAKDGERTAGRIFRQFDGEISHLQVSPFMGNSISERHYNARSRRAFRNVYRLPFPGVIHFLQVYYYRHNPYLWLTGLTRLITTARIFFFKCASQAVSHETPNLGARAETADHQPTIECFQQASEIYLREQRHYAFEPQSRHSISRNSQREKLTTWDKRWFRFFWTERNILAGSCLM